MGILSQTSAPVYEALERFRKKRVVPFDVPGHKRGRQCYCTLYPQSL